MFRSLAQLWIALSASVLTMVWASGASAQIINGMAVDAPADTNQTPGFSVHKEQRPVSDAFEDFERYRDKKAWEKAFGAIGKVSEGNGEALVPDINTGIRRLVPDKDGFLVPTELKVRAELLSLPPDGREAYRLFNDAKATQLLNAVAVSGPGEIPALTRIVNRYFITSVGDQAADRLGDALFETGDFANAEHCWQLILENFPDSSISPVLLQTKRAMALARYGQWDQFEVVRGIVHDRYAGQMAHIGGQDVLATSYVDGLRTAEVRPPTGPSSNQPGDQLVTSFVTKLSNDAGQMLPSSDQPVWQIPLMDQQASDQLVAQLGQSGWAQMAGQFTQAVPATAVDDKRVYVNWLGICFAADLRTGKLLWRTDTFGDMTQKMANAMMQGIAIDPAIYSTTLWQDKVLLTRRATDNQNYNELPMTRIHCLAADTGKAVWKSDSGSLSTWGFIGQPMIDGDALYMVAHTQGQQEISLLCIGVAKGDLRWKAALGTPAPSTNYRGAPTIPAPSMVLRSGKMLVLTNNGALLQVDCGTHEVDWAFSYPTYVETQQQWYGYAAAPSMIAPGELLCVGPLLYFKEYNSNVIFALDLAGPAMKWKRRIDPDGGIACFDGKTIFLTGSEIESVDAESRVLNWANKNSAHTGAMRPVVQGDWMYIFGSKGIDSLKLSTGESGPRFKGYDHDCDGGVLWKTPTRLVTVSSRAITAYPMTPPPGHAN